MGALRAGFHGTVGQPSAQVIDGSLKFDKSEQHRLVFANSGSSTTFTASMWVKRHRLGGYQHFFFSSDTPSTTSGCGIGFDPNDKITVYGNIGGGTHNPTDRVFRDTSSWYHFVLKVTSGTADLYVNNELAKSGVAGFELSDNARIGDYSYGQYPSDISMSQVYVIDGHALGPEYFGFTDPLTNTWRPKKPEFPKRSFTNPRWYSSATLYNSVADVVANATDRGNGGVTVTNEYCYLVFNDSGYVHSGGGATSPDYPVWTDQLIIGNGNTGEATRVFYYDSTDVDNWVNQASYGGDTANVAQWSQWRYTNGTDANNLPYAISRYVDIENGNMLVFCANANSDNPTNAGKLASVTLPTFDTNSFHFQNPAVDTWYTGGNSFYLPFDGNSPIGKDKFNNRNDWTPWYFGGSNSIEKATGALPILNTTSGGKIATIGVRTDATVAAGVGTCALALPLVGNKDDVSNQIDSKSSQKTILLNGDPTGITSISNFYGGSYYFDGTGDYLYTTSVYSDLNFKTGDFTIEAWCYASSNARAGLWQLSYTSGGLRPDDLQLSCHYQNDKFNFGSAGGSRINGKEYSTNRWHHVAEVRKDGVISTYINGVLDQSWTDTSNYWEGDTYVCVGGYWNTSYLWNGYIQDFRIYNGVAKYTENFIPASTNPDILPDTPSGVSGGSKLDKITSGAVAFDGTNDSLSIADSADFTFGSGDFTMEAFVYCNNASNNAHKSIINKYTTDNASSSWFWSIIQGLQYFYFYHGGSSGSSVFTYSNTTFPNREWVHCAIVRDGNTLRLFQDGVQINGGVSNTGDVTGLTMNDSSVALTIGEDGDTNYDMDGFISNARVIKGTALYTSNFTPPTEPLTNVTNTTLLCCQSNKLAGDAAVSPNLSGGLNDGTIWSEEGQSVNVGASTPMAYAFDGDTTSYVQPVNNTTMRYDFPFLITGTKFEMRVAVSLNINGFSVNGQSSSNVTASTGGPTWVDVTDAVTASGLGGLSYITMGYLSSNWSQVVYAFRIDDVILVDPVSAVNAKASTLNPFNTDINTVRGQETNHCTWNPLHIIGTYTSTYTYSNGNLDFTTTGEPNLGGVATIGVKSGRWYWEIVHTDGVGDANYNTATYVAYDTFNRFTARDRGIAYLANGQRRLNDVTATYGETYTTNDVIGVALDADNDKVTYFKNGKNQGELSITHLTPNTGYYPAIHQVNGNGNVTGSANFGQKPFKFPPPDGYQPLNNANVRPETVIARPDQYVGISTYDGNNATRDIQTGFAPDLVFFKCRNSTKDWAFYDSVRGEENRLRTPINTESVEATDSGGLTSFNYNGFTMGNSTFNNGDSKTYVSYSFKSGGSSGTFNIDGVSYATAAAAGLTAGDVTPTGASVGTKQGFSIIRWTAPTWNGSPQQVPHGLTQSPSFIITKATNNAASWYCYQKDLDPTNPEDYYITLNDTGAAGNLANAWGTNPPDNTTFGDRQLGWGDGQDVISYIWHDVPGLQKFGTYYGNEDTGGDGAFVELGFRPAIIMIKNTDQGTSAADWVIYDSERNKFNPSGKQLYPNRNIAEADDSTHQFDILSNGFKVRSTSTSDLTNATDTYIYCAWAESPAINLYGATSNAR